MKRTIRALLLSLALCAALTACGGAADCLPPFCAMKACGFISVDGPCPLPPVPCVACGLTGS